MVRQQFWVEGEMGPRCFIKPILVPCFGSIYTSKKTYRSHGQGIRRAYWVCHSNQPKQTQRLKRNNFPVVAMRTKNNERLCSSTRTSIGGEAPWRVHNEPKYQSTWYKLINCRSQFWHQKTTLHAVFSLWFHFDTAEYCACVTVKADDSKLAYAHMPWVHWVFVS